jgi:hypothetical protein
MLLRAVSAAALLALAGCQCRPQIPDADGDKRDTAKEDTAPPPHTGDTAPPVTGPCTIAEIEPNNAPGEAMDLPLETYLCGEFATALDFDNFTVVLPEDAWLGVYADAALRGSFADVILTVTSDVGIAASRDSDDEIRDSHLVFPALAGTYSVLVNDENFNGGDEDWFYELVATVAKDPFLGNKVETEPNDESATAVTVRDGDRVEGVIGAVADPDWYLIAVPAGKHHVVVDVEAYSLGAPTNLTLTAYENGLASGPLVVAQGLGGAIRDPYWEYDSNGNETLWFRLDEVTSHGGSAWWYGFTVTVEAS